jgi:hemerythrin-like domain-containing protein
VPAVIDRSLPEGMAWDGIGVLMAQHRQVAAIWERLEGSAGIIPEDSRWAMAAELVKRLSVHDGVEEVHLYPLVRSALVEGDELADRAQASHHEQARRLSVLEGLGPEDPGFEVGWAELMAEVSRHVAMEEGEIFPRLLQSVDRLTLALLAARIQRASRLGPTRPHPRVHQSRFLSRATAPALGAMDRLKDATRSRPGEGSGQPSQTTDR